MTQVLASKQFFNVLPIEIIKEILCYLEYDDLCPLKLVCSYWKERIDEILQIENISVQEERFEDATNIFREWRHKFSRLHIYRAQYNTKNINGQTKDSIWEMSEVKYTEVLRILQKNATYGDAYSDGSDDPVCAIHGEQY